MQKQQAQVAAPEAPRVVGQGTLAAQPGLPFLLVSSQSEPGRVHVCAYAYEGAFVGSRMTCDCVAAQYGKSCKHQLVARAWLAGRESVTPAHGTRAVPERWGGRDQRPFSLLKH